MEEIAQPFLESRLGLAADESVEIGGA